MPILNTGLLHALSSLLLTSYLAKCLTIMLTIIMKRYVDHPADL